MPEKQPHIINKQILDLNINNEAKATEIQDKAGKLCHDKLPLLMEKVFARLNIGDNYLVLPKLEIEISDVNFSNFEEEFLGQIEKELFLELSKKKEKLNDRNVLTLNPDSTEEEFLMDENTHLLSSFFEFLQYGYSKTLPSHLIHSELELQLKGALKSYGSDILALRKTFGEFIIRFPHALKRLTSQFSEIFVVELINIIWELSSNDWSKLLQSFPGKKDSDKLTTLSYHQRFKFYGTILKLLATSVKKKDIDELATQCQIEWNQKSKLDYHESIESKEDNIQNKYDTAEDNNSKEITHHLSKNITSKNNIEINTPEELSEKSAQNKTGKSRKIYIENAGLVIAATFLPQLYKNLGYLTNKEFNSEVQERAIQVAQFLVTGKDRNSENDLALNKILCGWPIEKPLMREIELTGDEIKESLALLESIIKNWKKIGNSSIDSIRETFLQRNGVLEPSISSADWQLMVERKEGYDILLDYLPWTISIIKLPWMQQKLFVEWQ